MPNYLTTEATSQTAAATAGKDRVKDGSKVGGNVLKATVQYTLLGTEATTETIKLVQLPAGARVSVRGSSVHAENPGTALTMDIGDDDLDGPAGADATDVDRYADLIVLCSGGLVQFSSVGTPDAIINPRRLNAQSWIYATIVTATSLTAGQVLTFEIEYTVSK